METLTSGRSMFMFHFRRKANEIYGVTGINFKWKENPSHTNLVIWPAEFVKPKGFFVLIEFEYLDPSTQKESYTDYRIIMTYYEKGNHWGKKEFWIRNKTPDIETTVSKILFWMSGENLWKAKFSK